MRSVAVNANNFNPGQLTNSRRYGIPTVLTGAYDGQGISPTRALLDDRYDRTEIDLTSHSKCQSAHGPCFCKAKPHLLHEYTRYWMTGRGRTSGFRCSAKATDWQVPEHVLAVRGSGRWPWTSPLTCFPHNLLQCWAPRLDGQNPLQYMSMGTGSADYSRLRCYPPGFAAVLIVLEGELELVAVHREDAAFLAPLPGVAQYLAEKEAAEQHQNSPRVYTPQLSSLHLIQRIWRQTVTAGQVVFLPAGTVFAHRSRRPSILACHLHLDVVNAHCLFRSFVSRRSVGIPHRQMVWNAAHGAMCTVVGRAAQGALQRGAAHWPVVAQVAGALGVLKCLRCIIQAYINIDSGDHALWSWRGLLKDVAAVQDLAAASSPDGKLPSRAMRWSTTTFTDVTVRLDVHSLAPELQFLCSRREQIDQSHRPHCASDVAADDAGGRGSNGSVSRKLAVGKCAAAGAAESAIVTGHEEGIREQAMHLEPKPLTPQPRPKRQRCWNAARLLRLADAVTLQTPLKCHRLLKSQRAQDDDLQWRPKTPSSPSIISAVASPSRHSAAPATATTIPTVVSDAGPERQSKRLRVYWECSRCSLRNLGRFSRCEACDSVRQRQKPNPSSVRGADGTPIHVGAVTTVMRATADTEQCECKARVLQVLDDVEAVKVHYDEWDDAMYDEYQPMFAISCASTTRLPKAPKASGVAPIGTKVFVRPSTSSSVVGHAFSAKVVACYRGPLVLVRYTHLSKDWDQWLKPGSVRS